MESTNTINPATGNVIRAWKHDSAETIRSALDGVSEAYGSWREVSMARRSVPLRKCAALLRERKTQLAALMAEEMGKPVRQGVSEAEKCAWVCEYYAEQAEGFLAPEIVKTEAQKSYVAYEPLGPILAIMPWNFPFWQFFRFVAPTLMAGNTVLLKHALNTTGCGQAIVELIRDAGYPRDVVRAVITDHEETKRIIQDPVIRGVTLTGSTRAGQSVATSAGAVLKRAVLELGGNDAYVVLADADVGAAAAMCVTSRLINTGQSCIAAKRFIVVKNAVDEFTDAMVELMKKKVVGDPMDEKSDAGSLARADLRDELDDQVRRSVAAGAKCLLGGQKPDGPGAYYPLTVLSGVKRGMAAFDEETFGPVAAIIRAEDEDDAVRLANDSVFGLGAAVFSRDIARAEFIARHRLQAGCCFVNDFVKSDPRLPFGGILESGYGRELGVAGIREFVNVKTVWIK